MCLIQTSWVSLARPLIETRPFCYFL